MAEITVQERRNKILELLHRDGKVRVNDLSKTFEVSEVSIRADLAELEEKELLSRVHGGAVSSYKAYYNMSLAQRSAENAKEKYEIAAKTAEMIHDDETLIMNAGTTPIFVMRAISQKKLTIVTNSIALALEGAKHSNLKIILLGGDVDAEYQFTYGTSVLKMLSEYHADKLILSVDGIDKEKGISTFYYQEAEICSKMIEQAKMTIVAADYTKIGRVAFSEIDGLNVMDAMVTNSKAPKEEIKGISKTGVKIILA
ncbi:MAG: DeoR/GlpR family DNA-binding transcription regulator [Bacillota bacterium]|nr:DeoR/GlpR family DNA-binding transcription regulator [Bacillota bacterium]